MATSLQRTAFESAAAHEGELTGRQREVLALVAKGHTNREIAEKLGFTVDGAKWHVGEILSKLGLDSREDAAEYWQWQRSPRRRLANLARAFVPVSMGKALAASGAVAVIGAGAVAAYLTIGNGDSTADEGDHFYLEALVHVVPGESELGSRQEPNAMELRWWYRDNTSWKQEIETHAPALDQGTTVTWAKDGMSFGYDSRLNVYNSHPLVELPDGTIMPPLGSLILGPVTWVSDADELIATFADGTEFVTEVVGTETILGVETLVIRSGRASPNAGLGGSAATASGSSTIWLDAERMVVLRNEVDMPGATSASAVVTAFHYRDFPAEITDFDLPGDARLVDGSSSSGSQHIDGSSVGAGGFFRLAGEGVPVGFTVRGTSVGHSSLGEPEESVSRLESDAGAASIVTAQRKRVDGLPPSLQQGTLLDVEGRDVYYAVQGDTTTLAFEDGGVSVLITAVGVEREALLALVAAMERVD